MKMSEVDEYLEHYGVKGMQWGVRKKKTPSADFQRHSGNRKKTTKELEDKELQALVNRLNMESQYSRLTAKPSRLKQGHNAVKGILAVGVTVNSAILFANSPAGKAISAKLKGR